MLELPEVLGMAEQLREQVIGKRVARVRPPSKEHKFCWYNGEPRAYGELLVGKRVVGAEGFGIFVEIEFDDDYKLCFNDGVNVRLVAAEKVPKNYQLLVEFEDGMALLFTVAMYGGIILHNGNYDNEYYIRSCHALSPFVKKYKPYYFKLLEESKQTLSVKAFLATEQRFPGIGNGVLQDILFEAQINPRRHIGTLSQEDKSRLFDCMISTLQAMIDAGGRDTEKNLAGNLGGYKTKMSKNTLADGCPVCHGVITKEAYLGGSVYYCPKCQPRDIP